MKNFNFLLNHGKGCEGLENQGLSEKRKSVKSRLTRTPLRFFLLLAILLLGVGQMWGASYTWSFTGYANKTSLTSGETYDFTSGSGSKTLYYVAHTSDVIKNSNNEDYFKMGGATYYSNSLPTRRIFYLTAPSAAGKITINYAASKAGNARILRGTNRTILLSTITSAVSSACESGNIYGLSAGTTVLTISFEGQSYIESITWTDIDAPTYTSSYYSEAKNSPTSGATYARSAGSESSGGSGIHADFAKYTSLNNNATGTFTFATPLTLNSNGSNKGCIRVYYGVKACSLSINGGNYQALTAPVNNVVNYYEYTIPDGTSNISTIAVKNTGSANGGLFYAVEVLTYPAASCTAPNHVEITGDWHIWNEGSMTLTAKAYASAGTSEEITEGLSYQWYLNGTEEGNKIAGATSATYSKDNCTYSDAGAYYCKISTGEVCSTTSSYYNVKMLQVFVKDGSSDYGTIDLTDIGSYEAQGTIRFASGSHTYKFGIRDGSLNWYGNNGTMTSSNCTNWSMDKNTDCQITTTGYGTYTFTVKFGNMYDESTYGSYIKVSVNYPSDDQASGKVIYFDNSVVNWSNLHYRVGKTNHNNATAMSTVPGTASLYKVTTATYNDLVAWHIANKEGWTNSNSIYKTNTGDSHAITAATEFDGAAVTDAAVTILPSSSHYTGGSDENNNCQFYYYTLKKFLVTHTATVESTTNGSIRLNWTDINDAAQSATSTTAGLAHTCNLTITGVPDAGYELATLTVNGVAFTSGNVHVLSADATIAATFTLHDYTVTHGAASNGSYTISVAGGEAVSTDTQANYNQTITLAASPAEGYAFGSWTVTKAGGGTVTVTNNQFIMPADDVTITATFTAIPVTSITVSPASKTLDVGGTQTLTATVAPATALDKAVTWSTGNGSIATVNESGVVTAVAPGSCTITATAHDGSGVTGTCSITVNKIQPTKYSFSVDKETLCGGETATLTLAGSQSGVTYELREDSSTPIAETQKSGTGSALTWTGLGAGTYVVYAVADATYTERQMDGSKITISNGTATSITTQPTNQEVTVGEEATLTVEAAGTSLSYQWKESATEGGTYSNVASSGTSASYSITPDAAGTKWYKCVVTGTCGTVTTDARKIVANAAASCSGDPTALAANTVYQAADMLSNCAAAISGTGQQIYGLSNNGKFYIVGTTNDDNSSTGTVEIKTENNTDVGGDPTADFTSVAYLKKAGNQNNHSIKFVVPAAGTLTVWGYTKKGDYGDLQIKPHDGDAVTLITHSSDANIKNAASISVTAGTYYILSNGGGAAIYGLKFVEAPTTYTVSAAVNPSGYGSLSASSITDVASGTAISASNNVLTVAGKTPITATPAATTAQYTYAFSNWTKSDGSALPSTVTADLTVRANFTCTTNTYTVTWKNGDATLETDEGVAYGTTPTYNGSTPTKASTAEYDYTFDAWSPAVASVTGNATYTATFTQTARNYTLSWVTDGDPLTGDYTNGTVAYGTTIVQPNTPTKTGNTFNGWTPAVAATMPAANTTYTATWTPVEETYTVTYDAQGGSVTPTNETVSTATLPTPTKSGYSFQGWYTSGGTLISGTYNPTANITLHALWREDECSGGGGGGGGTLFNQNFNSATEVAYTADQARDYKSSNTLSGLVGSGDNLFTSIKCNNKGNCGIGINSSTGVDSEDWTGKFGTYANNSSYYWSIVKSSNLAATAPTAVQIKFDALLKVVDNGTNKKAVTVLVGNGFSDGITNTLPGTDKIYTGFTFYTGSSSSKNHSICKVGSTTLLSSSEVVTKNTMNTFTWVINKTGKSLTYTAPTGSNETVADGTWDLWMGTTKLINDQSKNSGSSSFTGTTIQNLYIGSSEGVKHEFHLDNVDITDLTPGAGSCFYVRYSGNGAEGGFITDETAHSAGSNVTVLDNTGVSAYTKAGYTFMGWNTQADGQGTSYAAGSTINAIAADVTLHAMWESSASVYTLTWDANGGSDGACTGCTSGSVASGTTLVAPADPTLSNYVFDCWKTNNDGTGTAPVATMPAANTTYYAAWKQTVTLNTGSYGEGAEKTPYIYLSGSSLSDATVHTALGYTLNGYYTEPSGGTKVLNADGTLVSDVSGYTSNTGKWTRTGAAPTLYAQWRAAAGSTCYEWDATKTAAETGTNSYDGLYLTASSTTPKQLNNSSATEYTCFDISAKAKTLYGHLNGTEIASVKFAASTNNTSYTTVFIAFCSSTTFDVENIIQVGGYDATVYTVNKNDAAKSEFTVSAPAGTKSFAIGRNMDGLTYSSELQIGQNRYLYYLYVCSASGGTHTISYNAGGGTGTMTSDADIADDGTKILKTNTFTAPTNYSFAGWVADVNVTIGGTTVTAGTLIANGATITNITSDIALTAKWSQSVTLDDNDENHGATGDGSATAYYNATSLSSITHTEAATGYKLAGYYTAKTDGTKVLNANGSFASANVTDWISGGKWICTESTRTLYAQYESAGALTWNLIVNSDTANLSTSTKTSAFTEISTTNMTDAALTGLTYSKDKKSSLTGKISTPDSYDASKYVSVTFQVASGYKFTPSSIKVKVQPISAAQYVKLELKDNAATPNSINYTTASKQSKGSISTVEMTNGGGEEFTGTVTLKIFCYGAEYDTDGYRLGTPITIEGEVEETCGTMPSYSRMTYSQTEYTIDAEASAISIVGGENIDTYQWMYNTTNDRSSGTECGSNSPSLTPSTEEDMAGTYYYWCNMKNTACDITIQSPAVAITVSASKSNATIDWTEPASTPNYGGGGYTVKATVSPAGWTGDAEDLSITAPAGIRIYNVTSGTDASSKKYVQADFDVQTAFDRETYASKIPFTVSADATASYNAINATDSVSYSSCAGGGGDATEYLMPVNADSVNSTVKGWRFTGTGKMWFGHGSSTPSTGSSNIKSLSNTMADGAINKYYNTGGSYFSFYTEKAITGVRLYVYTSNNGVKVSNVYIANSQFATGTPSSGAVTYEVVYNDDNEGLDKGDNVYSAWAEITFASEVAAGKYGLIKLDNNVKIAGIGLLSGSSSGADLTTTLEFATHGPIDATASTANFTNTASLTTANTNSLGAITYSSNNSAASVNATTGEVSISAKETAQTVTITATLAASGCYKGATATYTINVAADACSEPSGSIELTSGSASKCSSESVTLTMTGFTSGATVQWYDGSTTISNGGSYTIATEGSTSTLTTTAAGTYSAIAASGCTAKRTNSITISNISAEASAEKIVDSWYVKNGRLTPDIALWTLSEGATFGSVAFARADEGDATAIGLSNSDCYAQDGIVYLKGKAPSSNDTGADIEYTLTLTVNDACGGSHIEDTKTITLIHQKNTDKHVLAFVVTGTENGSFTAGIKSSETGEVGLYKTIGNNFDVLPTNIYSTSDKKKLKEYYSQFDILCITDYPNTKKGDYVNAMGSLIDIRPILTMEAYVSNLANWRAKGISGDPMSPTTRQYSMLLQCKDHEIFSGTGMVKEGEGDETMYRVSMVNDTLEDYKTLDATYGAGTHEKEKNYNYGKKPALQGFTFTSQMSNDDLLPLGLIDDGSGNDLQVGIERQHEMEARLMVLGVNSYAMERLSPDGQTVIINALKYLMKKNAEEIADCSNAFTGEAEGDANNWENAANWSTGVLPDKTTREVRILAPVVIPSGQSIHCLAPIKIASDGTYNHGGNKAEGKITIEAGGALKVEGKIEAVKAPEYNSAKATAPEDLILNTSETAQSALIFNNDEGETQATVNLYSLGRYENDAYQFQYMAVPMEYVDVSPAFEGSNVLTYVWRENGGWERRGYYSSLYAFEGVGITRKDNTKETYTMRGTLASTAEKEITLTHGSSGANIIGNSWTAPINIAKLRTALVADANIVEKTVYVYITGNGNNGGAHSTTETAGQWLAIPIEAAAWGAWTGLKVIPAMQAYYIKANAETTMTLNYDSIVRTTANENLTLPLKAPKRMRSYVPTTLTRLRVADSKTHTDLFLFEGNEFTEEYDNGWEANFRAGDGRSARLYAKTEIGNMAVAALPELEGTIVCFKPGKETEYTFTFTDGATDYYLNDIKLKRSVFISEGESYTFQYEDGDALNRFYISRTRIDAPQVPTGVTDLDSEAPKARKVIYNDKMYIFNNGRVYDAQGKVVK